MALYITLETDSTLIKRGFSTTFEEPTSTDICIDTNASGHFTLFGVINPNMLDTYAYMGAHNYKWDGTQVLQTTVEERAAELESKTPIIAELTTEQKVSLLQEENSVLVETIDYLLLNIL